jgi:hypothetical protein
VNVFEPPWSIRLFKAGWPAADIPLTFLVDEDGTTSLVDEDGTTLLIDEDS